MRILSAIALLTVTTCFCHGQFGNSSGISVSGDAQVNVAPDRVTILLGVETRNKDLDMASAQNVRLCDHDISNAIKRRQFATAAGDEAAPSNDQLPIAGILGNS